MPRIRETSDLLPKTAFRVYRLGRGARQVFARRSEETARKALVPAWTRYHWLQAVHARLLAKTGIGPGSFNDATPLAPRSVEAPEGSANRTEALHPPLAQSLSGRIARDNPPPGGIRPKMT